MTRRKICIVTGSRAEYGLIQPVIRELQSDQNWQLQLLVTGMHLSLEFGLTYRIIEADGLKIDAKVEMVLASDAGSGLAKSIGLGMIGIADALAHLHPDLVMLAGDRYEIFAAAQAAMVLKIPIAHLFGGDTTEGAIDEAFRHSITKMAHLHFVSNQQAWQRVRQMGESADRIFNVGSPGIDHLKSICFLTGKKLEQDLKFKFRPQNLLVTFHPVTLDSVSSTKHLKELFKALDSFAGKLGIIFTKANADPEGRALNNLVDAYVKTRPHTRAFTSLGQIRYLSLMNRVDAIVGNSSSGLYEAPSLKKPTVDIGNRQKGRVRASSVIHCPPQAKRIAEAIRQALVMDCSIVTNPYGNGGSAAAIVQVLKKFTQPRSLLMKSFADLPIHQ
jgi:UDP-N-acetylglucosamine 2-epimerase (non-hydrolysing)/GDP/UDP-N,N'-diacetylbacillosamine 2-epimerase (hydrolysing)